MRRPEIIGEGSMSELICIECSEKYDPRLSSGSNISLCQDCFDTHLDCKTCGQSFDNNFNSPADNCPECSALEKPEAKTPSKSQLHSEIEAYMLGLIGGGFDLEAFEKYGVNASQATYVAGLICWHARASGCLAADLDGISATPVGHPMNGLMSYMLGGKDVALFEWIEAITEALEERFNALFLRCKA